MENWYHALPVARITQLLSGRIQTKQKLLGGIEGWDFPKGNKADVIQAYLKPSPCNHLDECNVQSKRKLNCWSQKTEKNLEVEGLTPGELCFH